LAEDAKKLKMKMGLWVPKDAEFQVDIKNITYLSEKCIYQKLFQNNIKIILKNMFFKQLIYLHFATKVSLYL
jgi:hypothetical protein